MVSDEVDASLDAAREAVPGFGVAHTRAPVRA